MGAGVHRDGPRRARILGAQRLPHVWRPVRGAALLGRLSHIEAVVFDVGETLVDETSSWNAWADHLGVDRARLYAALGDVVEAGLDHRTVFDRMAPGVDVHPSDLDWRLGPDDLYPDALPVLETLAGAGIAIGVVGNQPAATETFFETLRAPLDMIGSSASWGVTKPAPAFFARVVDEMGGPADRVAYVGDRLDNDVLPALDVGMAAVLVVRGPWGTRHALRPEATLASAVVTDLEEIPKLVLRGSADGRA